jgi:hypothetical protein
MVVRAKRPSQAKIINSAVEYAQTVSTYVVEPFIAGALLGRSINCQFNT